MTSVELPGAADGEPETTLLESDLAELPANVADEPTLTATEPTVVAVGKTRGTWFALATILAVAWLPYTAACILYWVFTEDTANWPYIANSLWEIVQQSAIVVVVLYVIYCDGRPWSTFGIRRPRWLLDPMEGLLIFLGSCVVLGTLYSLIGSVVGTEALDQFSESDYEFAMPSATAELLVMLLACLSTGLSEELVMRGYLIPTFERLLKSTPSSILLTSVLFASYHIYQGFGTCCGSFLSA